MSGQEKLNLLLNYWEEIRNIIKVKVNGEVHPRTGHKGPERE